MTIIIEQNENHVSFCAENAENHTTGDVVNLLMFIADKIIEEVKKQKPNEQQTTLELVKS